MEGIRPETIEACPDPQFFLPFPGLEITDTKRQVGVAAEGPSYGATEGIGSRVGGEESPGLAMTLPRSPGVSAAANLAEPTSRLAEIDARFGGTFAFIVLILAAGAGVLVHFQSPVRPFDDAFITFRYVDNFVRGLGPLYNEGQRVLGVTSPLYLVLLAALKSALPAVPIPELAVRFNAVPYAASGLAVYFSLVHFTGFRFVAAAGAATLLLDPSMLTWSTGAMESFLFTALLLFAVLAILRSRPILAGLLVGLTILARPEGALLIAVGGIGFVRSGRAIAKFLGTVLITLAPWTIFAGIYYGSPVPLSVVAKSKPLYPLPAGYAFEMIIMFLQNWMSSAGLRPMTGASLLALSPIWVTPILAAVLPAGRRRRAWVPGTLLGGLVVVYALGNPLILPWYLPPLCALAGVSVFAALPVARWGDHGGSWSDVAAGDRARSNCSGVALACVRTDLRPSLDGGRGSGGPSGR